jgi:hypothetical protein
VDCPVTAGQLQQVYTAGQLFLAGLLDVLALTPGGAPPVAFVANGQVALDSCCEGGMCWVSLTGIYPATHFPAQDSMMEHCEQLAAEFQIGVVRCAPGLVDNSVFDQTATVSPDDITASAAMVYADAAAIAFSVLQVIDSDPFDTVGLLGRIAPYGPQGGCVGQIGSVSTLVTLPGLIDG